MHTHTSPGVYMVQLTVTDNEGVTGSGATTITVLDPNMVVAPSNLAASESSGVVTLTWSDNANNESAYNIYRALEVRRATPVYELVGTAGENVRQYVDTVPTTGTFLYRVAAYRAASDTYSDHSDIVKVRVRSVSTSDGGTDDSTDTRTKCSPWPSCNKQ